MVLLSLALVTSFSAALPPWAGPDRASSIAIVVDAGPCDRYDRVVETRVPLPNSAGPVSPDELMPPCHLSEVSAGGEVLAADVPHQLQALSGRDAPQSALLTFLLAGKTAAGRKRYYRLGYGTPGGSSRPVSLVCAEETQFQGQASYRIVTPRATYVYHRQGAAFAALLDADGKDWIGYNPGDGPSGSGSGGKFRGVPNMGHPEGYCHPGMKLSQSRLVSCGPLKATIESKSDDGKMACRWDVFPYTARMTVLRIPTPYWFLYEGTPGGQLDEASDYCLRPAGSGLLRTALDQRWDGDIEQSGDGGEWAVFGDRSRFFFVAMPRGDDAVDSYWPMNGEMTVFGFGRQRLNKGLGRLPDEFVMGIADAPTDQVAAARVRSAYYPLAVSVGKN